MKKYDYEKDYPKSDTIGIVVPSVFLILGGICLIVQSIIGSIQGHYDSSNDSIIFYGLLIIAIGIFMLLLHKFTKKTFYKNKAEYEARKIQEAELEKKNKQRELYTLCVDKGFVSMEEANSKEIFKYYAKELGISEKDSLDYFKKGKQAVIEEQNQIQSENINQLETKEKEQYIQLTAFSNYEGKDKRIAMLTDRYNVLNGGESALTLLNRMEKSSQMREKDWAIAGGIANGIAGPAAGVAVALDIQRQNAEIRAQNSANKKMYDSMTMAAFNADIKRMEQLEKTKEQLDKARNVLVVSDSDNSAFNRLEFSKTSVDVSETGAFIVNTLASLKKPFTIYGNNKACVDGTIAADLIQEGKCVGTALLVIPAEGITQMARLKGICLSGALNEVPYEVKFKPYHLWEMEE